MRLLLLRRPAATTPATPAKSNFSKSVENKKQQSFHLSDPQAHCGHGIGADDVVRRPLPFPRRRFLKVVARTCSQQPLVHVNVCGALPAATALIALCSKMAPAQEKQALFCSARAPLLSRSLRSVASQRAQTQLHCIHHSSQLKRSWETPVVADWQFWQRLSPALRPRRIAPRQGPARLRLLACSFGSLPVMLPQ